jgi:urease accessory protein UreH
VLLPDPVAAFAGASYTQRIDVSLGRAGGCVLLDAMTSGRPSFGERWAMDRLDLRTSVRREGRSVVVDALVLDAADGPLAARASKFDAFATLIAVGESVRPVSTAIATVPVAPPTEELAVAASPLPRFPEAGAIARVAAARPDRALAEIRRRLRNLPDIGAVDPWICRP